METLAMKNERNARVQARYDELMREGKHGHYETMFRVVREEVEHARAALSGAVAAAEPLTPEQIREIAHRTCTEYRHMERVRYGFAEMHLWEFVRRVEAAHGIGSPCANAGEGEQRAGGKASDGGQQHE